MQIKHHKLITDSTKSPYVTGLVPGVTHHYVTAGSGPPLVLVHGFPQTWHQWRRLIAKLADRFTIIAPDLRGIGATPGPATGYDKQTLAADVHAIVAQVCGDTPALVVGHDMGAMVAYAYALRYSGQVSGLMLVDTPPPGTSVFEEGKLRAWHMSFHAARDVAEMLVAGKERAYIAQFVAARIYDTSAISEDDLDVYAAAYSAPGAMRAAFEMYRALDQDAEFNRAAWAKGKLALPVVAVGWTPKWSEAQLAEMGAEIAEDVKTVVIDHCGHWIPEEKPDVLAEAILELADEISSKNSNLN